MLKAAFALVIAGLAAYPLGARADDLPPGVTWRTATSLMGEPKHGADFQHYDYVNPAAPKGGTLNSAATGTFDSFNPYIVQGLSLIHI